MDDEGTIPCDGWVAGDEWGVARLGSAVGNSRIALSSGPAASGTRAEDNYSGVDECGVKEISPHTGGAPTEGVAKAGVGEG